MISWRDLANLNIFHSFNMKARSVLNIETPDGSITTLTTSELAQLQNIIAATTGTVYYAHSGTGAATQPGTKDQPRSTIDLGYNLCSAGDTLVVLPGHSEDNDADSGVDQDTVGVTVVGLGYGTRRPTVNFNGTDAAKDIKMAAASNRLLNILFICSDVGNDQAMAIEMSATDCELALCEFRDDGTSQPLNYISVGLANGDCDRCYIHDNKLRVTGSGSANSAISVLFDMTALRIERNDIYGDWDEAGIMFQTGANTQLDLRVVGNDVTNKQAGLYAIDVHNATSGSTGLVADNKVFTSSRAASLATSGCGEYNNRWSDGVTSALISDIDEDQLTYVGRNSAASTTAPVIVGLAGMGDDFFNNEWSMRVIFDAGAANAAPEGETRLISDYVSATGTFTVSVAFSAALADGDKVAVINNSLLYAGHNNPAGVTTNHLPTVQIGADRDGTLLERSEFSFDAMQKGASVAIDLANSASELAFTIAGGPILIHFMALKITAACSGNAALVHFESNPTVGTAEQAISKEAAAPDLQNAAIGDWFAMIGGSAEVLLKYATSAKVLPDILTNVSGGIIVDAGTIKVEQSTADLSTGTAVLSMVYTPMADGVTVS